ncbi:endonuclease [Glaciimonas immobilis]|uniref:Excinuclease cho n=1 Tax=Glaciimonas immobilis TaxID=728004 RepID=A0A840RRX6_9BURK|nr:endonuclease [Glaciimonas immobilis]KAF3996923.1 endonuclease [Glaciimonas immobilis]MBB5199748.1 excinuclease Cho [Glaciimonas immobilis]
MRKISGNFLPNTTPRAEFEYPSHIDPESLRLLPNKPGIYIFRGDNDAPLYVGKSINIRHRVLSHLRCADEARMLTQSRRVEFRRTAGDIGALLLESQLIKELQPLHNIKLRRKREMCALRITAHGAPEVVFSKDYDFASEAGIYGVFSNRRSALETLRTIVADHQLCGIITGTETGSHGRPCFSRQIKRCRGACVGAESIEEHQQRLLQAMEAMRVIQWPFAGAMGITEECDGWRQTHVIDHWMYLGSIDAANVQIERPKKRCFDIDAYKIIVKPFLAGQLIALT